MEAWAIILLVLAALVVAGLAVWWIASSRRGIPAPPIIEAGIEAIGDVDYFHSASYFTSGYWTDHYFTLAGSGTPPAAAVAPRGHLRNHWYYTGGG